MKLCPRSSQYAELLLRVNEEHEDSLAMRDAREWKAEGRIQVLVLVARSTQERRVSDSATLVHNLVESSRSSSVLGSFFLLPPSTRALIEKKSRSVFLCLRIISPCAVLVVAFARRRIDRFNRSRSVYTLASCLFRFVPCSQTTHLEHKNCALPGTVAIKILSKMIL